jgi:hypothetical protein
VTVSHVAQSALLTPWQLPFLRLPRQPVQSSRLHSPFLVAAAATRTYGRHFTWEHVPSTFSHLPITLTHAHHFLTHTCPSPPHTYQHFSHLPHFFTLAQHFLPHAQHFLTHARHFLTRLCAPPSGCVQHVAQSSVPVRDAGSRQTSCWETWSLTTTTLMATTRCPTQVPDSNAKVCHVRPRRFGHSTREQKGLCHHVCWKGSSG